MDSEPRVMNARIRASYFIGGRNQKEIDVDAFARVKHNSKIYLTLLPWNDIFITQTSNHSASNKLATAAQMKGLLILIYNWLD